MLSEKELTDFLYGQTDEMPNLAVGVDSVKMPIMDSFYICLICGHETSNYNKVCENCESWNGGDDD